jgi:hypothetical protein
MRFGDTLHVLPIASWLSKNQDVKIDWAYHQEIGGFTQPLLDIFNVSPFINAHVQFNYQTLSNWRGKGVISCWRPYHLIGEELNNKYNNYYDEVYCFGYSKDEYEYRRIGFFTEYFAEEHKLGVDYSYQLEYGEADKTFELFPVKLDKMYSPVLTEVSGVELKENTGIIKNLQLAAGAMEVITTRTGAAIALSLARIPFKIRFMDDDYDWYLKLCHQITGRIQRI